MIRAAVLACALAGCYQQIGDCGTPGVACSIGSGSNGELCAQTAGLGQICVPQPTTPATLQPAISTDDQTTCTAMISPPGSIPLCIVAGTDIVIGDGQVVSVYGSRALVLFASHDISINGTLDASSYPGAPPGAGAPVVCDDVLDGADDPGGLGAGGGAGGSFGALGGDGGKAGGDGGKANQRGAAGFAAGQSGGYGGGENPGVGGGTCGLGGGALYLIALDKTTIMGNVVAFGDGGEGAEIPYAGGGGGGSGGMIWIDGALVLASTAVLAATGGGGGGGGDSSSPGTRGLFGTAAQPGTPPQGAPVVTHGGNGGTGVSQAVAGGMGAGAGGGGGGGSQGMIKLPPGTLPQGQIYPPAT